MSAAAGKKTLKVSLADAKKAEYVYLEAANAYTQGRADDYIMLLRHAAALNPYDPFIAGALGEVTIQLSRDSAVIEKAYRALARRFEAEPSERAYYIPYAQAAEYLGRNDDRIHIWETLDRLLPDRTDPAMQLAEAMTARYAVTVDTADFNRAMRIYDRIEAATGPTPELTARKINALMQRNDTTSVMRSLGTLADAAPGDSRTNLFIGRVFEMIEKPDSALFYYNRAEAADTTDGTVYLARADFFQSRGDSAAYRKEVYNALRSQNLEFPQKFQLMLNVLSKQYNDTTKWAQIDDMFNTLEEINPGEAKLHQLYAEFKDVQGDIAGAAEQYSYSLDLDPNDSTVWAARVSALGRIPDEDALLRDSRHALELFPGNAYFSLMGSFVLARREQYPQALLLLDSADISLQRVSPAVAAEVHRVRGDYLEKLGMRDSSMTEYELSIGLDGNNFMAMNNCAYFMALDSINLDRAELYARMATESDSTSTTFIDTYAWVAYRKGDFEKARALIDRAIELSESSGVVSSDEDPESDEEIDNPLESEEGPSAEIYDHAGDIYFRCGDVDRAIEYWRRALAIEPDNKLIKKKISTKRIVTE